MLKIQSKLSSFLATNFKIIRLNRYLCTEGDISTVPFYTGSSYFPNSGIFFQKFNFWVFSQSIKRAIYNRTNYIHLHTLQVEDEKFVQICGKSLLWHADSSKSSDYLPLSYQSHFQFHLDHILSSYPILTTKLQYLICSSETRENILSESDHNYNTTGFIKIPGLISNIS